jgi:hypothetical protein
MEEHSLNVISAIRPLRANRSYVDAQRRTAAAPLHSPPVAGHLQR